MRKLGWIEGKNITIEYRFAEQKPERLAELAADLVRLKVDLIVATGLVVSLGWPGGNVTGLSGLANELNTKMLEVLKDAVPQTLASWTSADADRRPMERDQACGCGTEAQTGGD